jgi:hypothetical protein
MMPMCLIFSPDKSEKLLKGLTFFVSKKATSEAFFCLTKGSTRKTCNE